MSVKEQKALPKLVRDRIPEIIAEEGKRVSFRALSDDELEIALVDKFVEEVTELANARSLGEVVEEIADVIEVTSAIYGEADLAKKVKEMVACKKKARGGFTKGYCLEKIEEVK